MARRIRRGGITMVLMAAAGIVMIAMTGCTGPAASGVQAPVTTSPRPAAPIAVATTPELERGQVVATGEFSQADGSVVGHIDVVVGEHGLFDMHLSRLAVPFAASTGLYVRPDPVAAGSCIDTDLTFSAGDLSGRPTQYATLGDLGRGDPSFWKTAVLATGPSSSTPGIDDCLRPAAAVAPLTWTLPDMRPDLHVMDSGSAPAAIGEVVVVDGVPTSYRVRGGDVLGAIADRLGITTDDLMYLNPTRTTPGPSDQAYAGETLNLARAQR